MTLLSRELPYRTSVAISRTLNPSLSRFKSGMPFIATPSGFVRSCGICLANRICSADFICLTNQTKCKPSPSSRPLIPFPIVKCSDPPTVKFPAPNSLLPTSGGELSLVHVIYAPYYRRISWLVKQSSAMADFNRTQESENFHFGTLPSHSPTFKASNIMPPTLHLILRSRLLTSTSASHCYNGKDS